MTIDATRSAPIDVRDLSFKYGRRSVFEHMSFHVPEGALYALLGPNGAGKTTLMQILIGILRTYRGHATVNGRECARLRVEDRQRMGYVAEGLKLPAWMRLEQLEAYLAPLYPTWDRSHAASLRERFELDPKAKISQMSRGQYMKSALLCALAPRPKLLVLDEPFREWMSVSRTNLCADCWPRRVVKVAPFCFPRMTLASWSCWPIGWDFWVRSP